MVGLTMFRSILAKVRPVHVVMAAVFGLGLVVSGFKFLDAREVGLILKRLNWCAIPLLMVLPMSFLWLKAERFANFFEISGSPPTAGRERRLTVVSYVSAQLATLLPGGYVARVGLMEASLKRGARAVLPTLLEKVADLSLLAVVGLFACYQYPQTRPYAGTLLTIIAVVVVLAASRNVRERLRSLVAVLVSRFVKEETVRAALSGKKPSRPLALKLSLQTVGVLLIELTILWSSFAALGVQVHPLVMILAYAVADLVGRVAPTPGGFGLTEVGMVAFVHKFDAIDLNEAAAATFLFRFLLFLLPAFYGCLCYLLLWVRMTAEESTVESSATPPPES